MAGLPRINDHFHDRSSSDGHGTLVEHCRAAAGAGVEALCVTNHVEVRGPDGEWTLDADEAVGRFCATVTEIEAARLRHPGVRIRLGAEFEYRPEWRAGLDRLGQAVSFDFVIGSLHVVDGVNVSGSAGEAERFFAGRSQDAAYGRYFEALGELVSWGRFDVVGHFDLVKRYGHARYGGYRPERHEVTIRSVLSEMARRRIGLEVNASGLFQAPGTPYPEGRILRWAREEGVDRLTIGNDAHRPEHIARGLDAAASLARAAGWEWITPFEGRSPARVTLRPARSGA